VVSEAGPERFPLEPGEASDPSCRVVSEGSSRYSETITNNDVTMIRAAEDLETFLLPAKAYTPPNSKARRVYSRKQTSQRAQVEQP
jgi:hypothetical protein